MSSCQLMCNFCYGEMRVITHVIVDRKTICSFRSGISQNLKPVKSKTKDIKLCLIIFVMCDTLLCKHLFCPKLNVFIFCSLVQLSITIHTLGISHISVSLIRSLRIYPKNTFFIIGTLRITNKVREFFLKTNFWLFSISKMKSKRNCL